MRGLLCLLAVALLAAVPAHCRQLKVGKAWQPPHARVPHRQTHALATLPLSLVNPDERRISSAHRQPMACIPSTPLQWRPVPVDRQCVDRFNAMVQSGLCSQGSTPALCCAALADMGYSCLDAIVAANVEDHRTYGQAMEIT